MKTAYHSFDTFYATKEDGESTSPIAILWRSTLKSLQNRQNYFLMIQFLLGKRIKFGRADKCYVHKLESIIKNETHKILSGF